MNKTVQGMRTIAMLAIFAYHAGLLPNGYFPVTFFFMVSGFGIYTAKHGLEDQQLSWRSNLRWMGQKFRYFYAVHLLLFLVSIPIRWEEMQLLPHVAGRAVLQLTLTQSWYPGLSYGFNSLSWYLSALLFVYLAAFWAVRMVRSCRHSGIAAAAVLAVQLLYNAAHRYSILPLQFEPYYSPLYRVTELILGMFAAKYLLEGKKRHTGGTLPEVLVVVLLAVQYLLYCRSGYNLPVVFVPAFFIAICVFGQQKGLLSRVLQWQPIQWMARYGFEFYMVHELLIVLLRNVLGMLGISWRMRVILFTLGAFAGALLFSAACQKWLKPRFSKKKAELAAK